MKVPAPSSSEAPDVEAATDEYAERFSGPVGRWFLKVQAQATLDMLSPYDGATVLDVGGGHGQTAEPLVREGYDLTVLGSSKTCARQIGELVRKKKCNFKVGNIFNLPFADDSFDAVVSYRMLAHIDKWRPYLSELSRVASYAVLVDYPEVRSFNFFNSLVFRFKKQIEGNTRPYNCFRMRELLSAFENEGMQYSGDYRQFFWPMAIHRALNEVKVSMAGEKLFRSVGLTARWGSPVILRVSQDRP